MRRPRVALLGCGRWGEAILRDLSLLGCAVFVADPSPERRRFASGRGATVTPDAASLPPVDGIVVATPTSLHEESILGVAGRGVPVYCEKPLTADPLSARRLSEALTGRLFVMDKWRYHAGVLELAAIARDGRLGAPRSLRTARLQEGSDHADVDGVWILAPHDLSIALEILGQLPRPLSASGEADGGHATALRGILGRSPSFEFEVSTRSAGKRREIRLVCEGGAASWSSLDPDTLRVRPGSGPPEDLPLPGSPSPLLRELSAFVDHLAGGPPPKSSASDGALVVETLGELRAMAGLDGPG